MQIFLLCGLLAVLIVIFGIACSLHYKTMVPASISYAIGIAVVLFAFFLT